MFYIFLKFKRPFSYVIKKYFGCPTQMWIWGMKRVKTITFMFFGSQNLSKPSPQHYVSLNLFGSCLSFCGCKISLREKRLPREPMVGLDTRESHPGFIITLYNTQRPCLVQLNSKWKWWGPVSPSRGDVALEEEVDCG